MGERMSGVDTAWLRMERPTNPMAITAVLIFRTTLTVARLKKALRERFLAFDRFRQRPVQQASGYYWEEDRLFDLDRHVHRIALPRPGGRRELQDLVSDLASTALDPERPRWQFHLVEGYGRSGSALVMRIHHCYADGVALMRVLLALTTGAKPGQRSRGGLLGASLQWSGVLWQNYVELLLNPARALEYMQTGAGATLEAIKLLSLPPEPATRFRGELGLSKRVAWCEPLKLAAVKKAGKAFGCTVNDVLLAAAAGALGAYLTARREPVKGLEIHVVVPVNLRSPESAEALGNEFGLVFLGLPLGIADPVERLQAVHERMEALRRSPQPMLMLGLLGVAGQAPMAVQEQLLELFSAHATAVMTNVPGPQSRLRFAGAEIAEQMFWVPQSGGISMGASILSYAGQVQFGLMTDAGRVPDPERIVAQFPVEIARLQEAVP